MSSDDWREAHVAMCSNCANCGERCILQGTGYWFAPNLFNSKPIEGHLTAAYHNSPLVCMHYRPAAYCKWVLERWQTFSDYFQYQLDYHLLPNKMEYLYVPLVSMNDFNVYYHVRYLDFLNNDFVNKDGTLQYFIKCYYKRTRKSVTGYEFVYEWTGKDKYKTKQQRERWKTK